MNKIKDLCSKFQKGNPSELIGGPKNPVGVVGGGVDPSPPPSRPLKLHSSHTVNNIETGSRFDDDFHVYGWKDVSQEFVNDLREETQILVEGFTCIVYDYFNLEFECLLFRVMTGDFYCGR